MFSNTRSTPHTRIQTTQSRHDITSLPESTFEAPQPFLDIQDTQRHFHHPPQDHPQEYYLDQAIDFRPTAPAQNYWLDRRSSNAHLIACRNVIESHWIRDVDGNVVSTVGQVHSIPSDADTADLENLESMSLPPDTMPPPPPLMRTAQLPSSSSSGRPPDPTSLMGSLSIIFQSESLEENELLKEPTGTHTRTHTTSFDDQIRMLRDLMSQTRRCSPPSRILPDQLVISPPPLALYAESGDPQPTEMSNRLHTCPPFQSSSSNATRLGKPLTYQVHRGILFEPQSTSSPPRSRSRSPSRTKEPLPGNDQRSNSVSHDALPPRQSVASRGLASTSPPSYTHPDDRPTTPAQHIQVPVNLPHSYDPESDRRHASMFDSRHRPTTSHEYFRSQEPPQTHADPAPAETAPSHVPFPPQWPGCSPSISHPPFYAPGYVPYAIAKRVENGYAWDGRVWRHADELKKRDETASTSREDTKGASIQSSGCRVPKDHTSTPAAPERMPLTPSKAQYAIPSSSSQVEDPLECMRRRLDTLHQSVIHEHWTNLDSYFKGQTDPAFIAFVGSHTSVSSRIRRLLDKLLGFLAGALSEYPKLQAGSEDWHKSWRKQLSSLDRTMRAFCNFSSVVCNRESSFRMLDKVLAKYNQYESKFRDLTKKIYTLLNRLRLRALHSDLVQAHTKAQEQLRIAGSRRDVPRWDEDKNHRAKLREDFISLQNRIALSRWASWAESQ